jgi:predicted transcriptional regulator
MKSLTKGRFVVTEQHLYLALESYDSAEEGSELYNASAETIMMYAVEKLDLEKGEFTEDELIEETQSLIIQHTLNKMIHKGLIDADFDGDDVVYGLTEEGKDIVKKLTGDNND